MGRQFKILRLYTLYTILLLASEIGRPTLRRINVVRGRLFHFGAGAGARGGDSEQRRWREAPVTRVITTSSQSLGSVLFSSL